MANQVTMYETRDGEFFHSQAEAEDHDKFLYFGDWYEENKLYGNTDGCRIEWKDLIEWLQENKKEVKQLMKFI